MIDPDTQSMNFRPHFQYMGYWFDGIYVKHLFISDSIFQLSLELQNNDSGHNKRNVLRYLPDNKKPCGMYTPLMDPILASALEIGPTLFLLHLAPKFEKVEFGIFSSFRKKMSIYFVD